MGTDAHKYILPNMKSGIQSLQFYKMDGEDGTTNEDVLTILIHRINLLNKEFPCRENSLAITKLEEALMWLNHRTADRINRKVEGKKLA